MKIGDIFIILSILILSGFISFFFLNKKRQLNDDIIAIVEINGEVKDEVPLTKGLDETKIYSSEFGENEVVFKDDGVYIKDADCKDKYCILMGKIDNPGENIVCLPNRLIVKLISTNPNLEGLDAIN